MSTGVRYPGSPNRPAPQPRRQVSRVIGGLTPTEAEPPVVQYIQRTQGPNLVGNITGNIRGNFQ
jgi:hypothetical protein